MFFSLALLSTIFWHQLLLIRMTENHDYLNNNKTRFTPHLLILFFIYSLSCISRNRTCSSQNSQTSYTHAYHIGIIRTERTGSVSVLSSVIFSHFMKESSSKSKKRISRSVTKGLHTMKKMLENLKDRRRARKFLTMFKNN